MQFKTEIWAVVPRSRRAECGVKTIAVPWTGEYSRFTWIFEAVAIKVLQAAANVKQAAELLGFSWEAMHSIIERAVDRGLARCDLQDSRQPPVTAKSPMPIRSPPSWPTTK